MNKLYDLIKEANEVIINNNFVQLINDNESVIKSQDLEIKRLTEELFLISNKNLEEISTLKKNLDLKNEENNDLRKVSIIQKVNKQLDDKNIYINILESQIEKFKKNTQPVSPKLIQIEIIKETKLDNKPVEIIKESKLDNKHIEIIKETEIIKESKLDNNSEGIINEPNTDNKPNKNKSKKKNKNDSNTNNYVEINRYELLEYKKKLIYRDIETNQIYDILDNKPNNVIGLYTNNGKIKLN